MCRYCKNLKRIKDLDEKEYKKIIQRWKNHVYYGERIMKDAKVLLSRLSTQDIILNYEKKYIIHLIDKYITTNTV